MYFKSMIVLLFLSGCSSYETEAVDRDRFYDFIDQMEQVCEHPKPRSSFLHERCVDSYVENNSVNLKNNVSSLEYFTAVVKDEGGTCDVSRELSINDRSTAKCTIYYYWEFPTLPFGWMMRLDERERKWIFQVINTQNNNLIVKSNWKILDE